MRVYVTKSEKKILELIHLSNIEIAQKLIIEVPTVKAHIHHLLLKFNAKNRTELLRKAIHQKIIKV